MTILRMDQVSVLVSSLKRRLLSYSLATILRGESALNALTRVSKNCLKLGGINHSAMATVLFFAGACLPLWQRELFDLTVLHFFILIIIGVLLIVSPHIRAWLWLPAFFCVGFYWSSYTFTNQLTDYLSPSYERVSIEVRGKIVSLPHSNQGNTRFVFEIGGVIGSYQQIEDLAALKDQRVQLSCYRCPYQFEPNQNWHFTVRLKRPHGYASWGAFDYEKYLFRHKLIATGYLRTKDVNRLLPSSEDNSQFFNFNDWRWRIKNNITQFFQKNEVGSHLILALTIGDKSGLSSQQRSVLQMTGTSHLMAISGLHVGLVFMVLLWLFTWLLKPFAKIFEYLPCQHIVLLPSLLGAFFYAGLAGFAVSTQRAFIMLSVYALCRLLGLLPSLLKVLLIAVWLIILFDPNSVLDIGFWLSCSAVLIIALHSQSEANTDDNNQTISLLKLQPVLWLGMLPLGMTFFGQISLVSPLVNLIAVPLFCLLLIPLTLCATVLNEIGVQFLAEPLLGLSHQIFNWAFAVLQWISELGFASWAGTPVSNWVLMACFLVVLSFLSGWWWRKWSWLLIAIAVFVPNHEFAQDKLIITLMDVGQGLAMVVEQDDYTLVYDTGPAYQSGFTAAQAVLVPYLHYRGIERVDTLVISHADNDHIGGYETLMSAFPVPQVLTSRTDKLPQAQACYAGQIWSQGEVEYQIISPDRNTPDGSNNRSCVLRISYGSNVVLITGDIEKQVEQYLLKNNVDLAANILLVPHQGSKTSSTSKFIDAVAPDLALVAAGYLNHYRHPHPDVIDRYHQREVAVRSTIDSGSIQIEISNFGWKIKTFRDAHKRFWRHRKVPKVEDSLLNFSSK